MKEQEQQQNQETFPLNHLEKQAIIGTTLRERLLMEELQREFKLTLEAIEERLGLEKGALNTTHAVDLQAGTVVKRPIEELSDSSSDNKISEIA